jgi:hypothetical protein
LVDALDGRCFAPLVLFLDDRPFDGKNTFLAAGAVFDFWQESQTAPKLDADL